MKTQLLSILMIFLSGSFGLAQTIPPDSLYLGQTPPGNTPVVFNLSVDPDFFAAERIAISHDSCEIFYSEVKGYYPINTPRIKKYSFSGGHWTGPFQVFDGYLAAALSVTGDTMFFQNASSVYETFISVRNGSAWGSPERILNSLNSAHYLQVTNNGHHYISTQPDSSIGGNDWCRLFINGTDTSVSTLGLPLNTTADNLDFYISRDESFMIIAKPGGLCVSYHKSDGNWTNPKNLGSEINFGLGMWGPFVSSDKKYLFYTTGTNPNYSDTYVYWVRVDNIIDSLMYTNYIPYLKNKIPDQNATVGQIFNYTIPDSTFVDDDGNNTLSYAAKLFNGNPLPGWLSFDSISLTFSGVPDVQGSWNIKVKVTDTEGASASTIFKITADYPTGIVPGEEHGVRVFPNPSSGGLINVAFDSSPGETAFIEISNLAGQVFHAKTFKNSISLNLADKPKGLYIIKVHSGNQIFVRKVCID